MKAIYRLNLVSQSIKIFIFARERVMVFFFFNDTANTEIYTLSLHDALPIFEVARAQRVLDLARQRGAGRDDLEDRKSTRLNSSHRTISYAVFYLKKKKNLVIFIVKRGGKLNENGGFDGTCML